MNWITKPLLSLISPLWEKASASGETTSPTENNFLSISCPTFKYGSVIIEEKIDGEESSFMAFCDGKHFIPLPDTRDYKRAFDDDKGPNTGGMGSYKDVDDKLPFLTAAEREQELVLANKIFKGWRAKIKDDSALRGVPLYLAFMHTGKGIKVLEINSRPGDPEIINLLALIKDDFVELCFKMVEGNLTNCRIGEGCVCFNLQSSSRLRRLRRRCSQTKLINQQLTRQLTFQKLKH